MGSRSVFYTHSPACLAILYAADGLIILCDCAQSAITRALAYAPYSDLVWLETKKPDLEQARMFAKRIRDKFPGK